MSKLVEGDRPFSAVNGQSTSASEMNTMIDELATVLGPRWLKCWPGGFNATTADSWLPSYSSTSFLLQTAAASKQWWGIVPVYAGQKILDVRAKVAGPNDANDGYVVFYYGTPDAGMSYIDLTNGTTNCWRTGGADRSHITTYTYTGLNYTMTTSSYCYLRFTSSSNSKTVQIYDYDVRVQFGN